MRTLVASKIGNLLKREIMKACSKNTISLFNDKSVLVWLVKSIEWIEKSSTTALFIIKNLYSS